MTAAITTTSHFVARPSGRPASRSCVTTLPYAPMGTKPGPREGVPPEAVAWG